MESFYANAQRFFDEITERLKLLTRWSGFGDRRMTTETDVDHTMQTALLAMLMLWQERRHGDPATATAIDGERLIALAVLHDAGEGIGGDIRHTMKKHPILGPLIRRQERLFFLREIIGRFPDGVRDDFQRAYELQEHKDDPTGAFFWAVEVVGYLIRALDEYRTGSKALAYDVFDNTWGEMRRLADHYASVRFFYDAMRIEVDHACATSEGRAAIAAHSTMLRAVNGVGLEQALEILEVLSPTTRDAMQQALVALAKRRNGDGNGTHARDGVLQPTLPFDGAAAPVPEDGQ